MNVAEANRDPDEETRQKILAALGDSSWENITPSQPITEDMTTPAPTLPSAAPASATTASILSSAAKLQDATITTTSAEKQSALVSALSDAAPGVIPPAQAFERASYTPVAGAPPLALPQDFQRASYTPVSTDTKPLFVPPDFSIQADSGDQGYAASEAVSGPIPRAVPADLTMTPTGALVLPDKDSYAASLATSGPVPRAELFRLPDDEAYGKSLATSGPVPRAELVKLPDTAIAQDQTAVVQPRMGFAPRAELVKLPGVQKTGLVSPPPTVAGALPAGAAPPIQPALSTNVAPFQPDTSGSTRLNARYNNPGAMGLTQSAVKFGATPSGHYDTGHAFAQFPSREAGAAAQFSMWQNPNLYKGHTLAGAITNWVGPGETGEAEFISKKTGIPLNTVITDEFLRGPQGLRLMQAQAQYEGANVLTPEQWQRGQDWAYKGIKPGDAAATVAGQPTTTTTATAPTAAGGQPDLKAEVDALINKNNSIVMPKEEDVAKDDLMGQAKLQAIRMAKSMQDSGIPINRVQFQSLLTGQFSALQNQQIKIAEEQRHAAQEVAVEAAKRALPQRLAANEADQLSAAQAGFDQVDNLMGLHQTAEAQHVGGHWLNVLTRKVNPAAIAFDTSRDAAMTPVAKGVFGNTGNLSEMEQKSGLNALPDLGDSHPVAQGKADRLKLQIANKTLQMIEGYQKSGYDVSGWANTYNNMKTFRDNYMAKIGAAPGVDAQSKDASHSAHADYLASHTTTQPSTSTVVQSPVGSQQPTGSVVRPGGGRVPSAEELKALAQKQQYSEQAGKNLSKVPGSVWDWITSQLPENRFSAEDYAKPRSF